MTEIQSNNLAFLLSCGLIKENCVNLKIGIGFSQHENVLQAAKEAAEQAKNEIAEERLDMVILLTTPQYSPAEVLPIIEDCLKNTRIIGGSTAGIILNDGLSRQGIAVFAFRSDTIKFQTLHSLHLNLKDLTESGEVFVKEKGTTFGLKDRKLLMFFFDGLLENLSAFTEGIHNELGEYFPLIAAGTSDQFLFSKTEQYHDRAPSSNSSCGVILGGDISACMACRHGWKPLGKPRLIKKSRGNIIEKIGDAPAIQIYEDFFKDNLGSLKNDVFGKLNARYPLGVFTKHHQEYSIRNVMDILEDGSIACQDIVKEGSEIHIMIGNKSSCLQSAANASNDIQKALNGRTPQCLFIFESATRWQILKHSWHEELKIITDILGKNFPIMGMLTYGEIFNPGTLQHAGKNSLLSGNIMLMAVV